MRGGGDRAASDGEIDGAVEIGDAVPQWTLGNGHWLQCYLKPMPMMCQMFKSGFVPLDGRGCWEDYRNKYRNKMRIV